MYPSKFCWFPGDGKLPSNHYDNKLDIMKELNNAIIEFHNETHAKQSDLYKKMLGNETGWDGSEWEFLESNISGYKSLAPAFNTFSVRKRTAMKAGKAVSITNHRWSWWRETEAEAKKVEEERKNANE